MVYGFLSSVIYILAKRLRSNKDLTVFGSKDDSTPVYSRRNALRLWFPQRDTAQ